MDIHLTERIACGSVVLRPLLLAHLTRYHDDPSGDPPVLDAAGVRIPILVDVGAWIGNPPEGANIVISARRHRERYPVFAGTLRVVAVNTLSSELILDGRYDVPLGLLGVLADRTILATTAERSLRRLLATMKDDLATAALDSVMGKS